MNTLFDILGWLGMITFLAAYYGISTNKLKVDDTLYHWMNFLGAIAVSFSVFVKHAWPAFTLEVIWGAIALISLIKQYRMKKAL